MAYGEFYVEHQGWARWPKTLIMCRKRGYEIIERRRYIPERTCRIEERHGDWYCTRCDEMVGTCDPASELCVSGNMVELWNYCPNCGAKVVVE